MFSKFWKTYNFVELATMDHNTQHTQTLTFSVAIILLTHTWTYHEHCIYSTLKPTALCKVSAKCVLD